MPRKLRVCVTGASGYLGSHVVAQLLAKGYEVNGTVRDATDPNATEHLLSLPCAAGRRSESASDDDADGGRPPLKLFSTGDLSLPSTSSSGRRRFDDAVRGCSAVVHCACPIAVGDGICEEGDGEARFVAPAVRGTEELLDSVSRVGAEMREGECRCTAFILTSSVAAVSSPPGPVPPNVLTEEHRSDPETLRAKGKWYRLAKTLQERVAVELFASPAGPCANVRFVSLCPGWIFGPMLQPRPNATMNWLAGLYNGEKARADNASVGFIDVRDVAALHVAAVEDENIRGRYLCVRGVRSEERVEGDDNDDGTRPVTLYRALHWNEVFMVMRELHPAMPPVADCDGEPVRPKHYDLTRMNGLLGIDRMRDVRTTLKDSLLQFKERGMLS